ncbi:glycerol-3-phosphate 1-O-acyltransferase PlsY [Pueribacillus sp. YX66]|uniref:glycerol-3-phosphate 1-O-acyltransferase PlsY n=1 Tax=Pueribacillus sp. YX66 TaxID=3229242 RepID=UPI00358CE0C7
MNIVFSIIIGYLLGSISFSYLLGKYIKKVDIRKYGSGNAGATNTLRVLGKGPAIAVLLLDIAKGIVAVMISSLLGGEEWVPFLAGLFAIIGHNWPIFFGFRGGKGIATTIGVLLVLVPYPALLAGVGAIILIFLTRYVSLGSLVFTLLTPIFILFFDQYPISFFYSALIFTLLSIWQHRVNIKKLIQGNENKIGEKSKIEEVNNS